MLGGGKGREGKRQASLSPKGGVGFVTSMLTLKGLGARTRLEVCRMDGFQTSVRHEPPFFCFSLSREKRGRYFSVHIYIFCVFSLAVFGMVLPYFAFVFFPSAHHPVRFAPLP